MKLSRPAWNNVLILATLIMILAFNGVHKKLLSNAEESAQYQAVIPENSLLLTIDYGAYQLERIGRDWRIVGNETLPQPAIESTVNEWQTATGKPLNEQQIIAYNDLLNTSPWVITLWLAGEEKGLVTELFVAEQQLLLRRSGDILVLPYESFKALVPNA